MLRDLSGIARFLRLDQTLTQVIDLKDVLVRKTHGRQYRYKKCLGVMLRLMLSGCVVGLASCALHQPGPDLAIPGSPPLRYVTVGSGPALVVVLHGGPGVTHDYLRPEWDRLALVGQVVYYDQRGCGANLSSSDLTWQAHVADLDRLIRRLRRGRKVFLAGSSWGAELALLYAYVHPESLDALVLSGFVGWPAPDAVAHLVAPLPLGTAPGLGVVLPTDSAHFRIRRATPGWLNLDSAGQSGVVGSTPSSLFNQKMATLDSVDLKADIDAYIQRQVKKLGAVSVRQTVNSGQHSKRVYAMPPSAFGGDSAFAWRFPMVCYESGLRTELSVRGPPLAALSAIRTPTLVISGGRGSMPDLSRQLVGVLPDLTVRSIAGGGHDPWYSRPDIFFSTVSSFLRKRLD